ncbi:hypothetical protein [Streptomyces sp. NPDC020965]|uniref:hypothetical protein n=1 Tax=Streptomyces sp. NPDC020965 TaxID=3365105 RepID=UPI0037B78FD0
MASVEVDTVAAGRPAQRRITLITGDRVVVDARHRVISVERAAGREHIPMHTWSAGGRTYVVPIDARQPLADGRLDQRLFDLTALGESVREDGLRVIVGYNGATPGRASEHTGARSTAETRARVRGSDGTAVRHTLRTLNADALTTPHADLSGLWKALTHARAEGSRTTASGIARVWLDGTPCR